MKININFLVFLLAGALLLACKEPHDTIDIESYHQEIEEWKAWRLARLTRDDGWLTLAGLFWLKEGKNSVGSNPENHVVLPKGKTPEYVGSIWLKNNQLRFDAKKGVDVRYNDSTVSSMVLQTDEDKKEPTILRIGPVSFYVIKRGEQLAVRVKDNENPARLNFKGLDYFPVSVKWRLKAKFEPYKPAKILEIPSIIGTIEKYSCPGALIFEIEGKQYRLDATSSENQLFIMFTDETNGKETYKMGRPVYTSLPDSMGIVILDFNKAYNWPCVFTEFATCPIVPPQNHIPVRIEAGEKMYIEH